MARTAQLDAGGATAAASNESAKLLAQYGCGPIRFVGTDNAFYERHLVFDSVVDPAAAGARERFEALARSVRDILAHRWVLTHDTHARADPKRVYYLSMEFLIGRSLANNVTNLVLDPLVEQNAARKNIDWLGALEGGHAELEQQRPRPSLNVLLGPLATLEIPAMGYGLR